MTAIKKINNCTALHGSAQANRRLKPFETPRLLFNLAAVTVHEFTKWPWAQ